MVLHDRRLQEADLLPTLWGHADEQLKGRLPAKAAELVGPHRPAREVREGRAAVTEPWEEHQRHQAAVGIGRVGTALEPMGGRDDEQLVDGHQTNFPQYSSHSDSE